MESIRQWFKAGRPYDEGVQLYIKHGTDSVLKMIFTREERTAFKVAKLQEALRQLLPRPATTACPTISTSLPPAPLETKKPHAWPPLPIEDQVLKALWEQWRPKYAELKSLQQRLYHVALGGKTDVNKRLEAGQMAHRILDLADDVEALYIERDHYLDTGSLISHSTSEAEVIDPVRWATELKNNERYVRDYKAKLAKEPNHKNAVKWADKLKEKQALLAKYKKLLKLDE